LKTTKSPPVAQRAYFTTAMLSIGYALSYIDRLLPNLMIEPIKADLQLSDTQVSLLSGLSFAILYSIAAIPLARLADSWSRRGVIVIGLILWGAATALCGLASSFAIFFLMRMGVGLGEAGLTPAAYSLLADLFPPGKRARPTGIFVLSTALGSGVALLAGAVGLDFADSLRSQGGWWASIASWRLVLIWTGLATLALVPFMIFIADPKRVTHNAEVTPFREVLSEIWKHRRAYSPLMVGIPVINLAAYGALAWVPTFFIRTHGWSIQEAGLAVGGASIVGGIIGGIAGSWFIDYLNRRSASAALLFCVGAVAGCLALSVGLVVVSNASIQITFVLILSGLVLPIGVTGAVCLQDVARPAVRAQVSSIYLMLAAIVGVGLGPTLVAVFTDFVFANEGMLGWSIASVWLLVLSLVAPIILWNLGSFHALASQRRIEAQTLMQCE
jgi:MFS family permease